MHSRYEPIAAGDGRTFSAYVAEPAHANGHAVTVSYTHLRAHET